MIHNVLSIDLESFIHREFVPKKRLVKDDDFTLRATTYLLDLFSSYKIKTTFFVVGEIFEWYPELLEEIKKQGHEVAWHTHRHVLIDNKKMLEKELKLSEKFLTKYSPIGFRATRMHLPKNCLPVLKKAGFLYDSSTYNSFARQEMTEGIREIPVSLMPYPFVGRRNGFGQNFAKTLRSRGFPYGSGLVINLLQKNTAHFIDTENHKKNPAILFLHPWQFFDYPHPTSLRYLLYGMKVNQTAEYLLSKYTFIPMRNLLSSSL